ncbi:MAG: helix-turn-helix domain-containing protein [Crocinitomicaceae bacterium]|nr:helix-turn-helix domain-containing protein [Crocinitomicaceae bacterium]
MYDIFIPKSEILQKYIHNICVMQAFSEAINYLAFPQLGTSIAFYKHTKIVLDENCIYLENNLKENTQVLLLGKYTLPIQLHFQQYTPEVSINFTATGLNYFFEKNTDEIASENVQLITSEIWTETVNQIFEQETSAQKVEVLEERILSILIEKDISLTENFISIMNENPEQTITDIAANLGVSSKTINRQFTKYVGCSPMEYKKIVRFRKAIQTKFSEPFKNLTQVCFDSNFYDSPHFTREFKKLTQLNPRDFFTQIDDVGKQAIPYKFL